jgi:hypothetical protein
MFIEYDPAEKGGNICPCPDLNNSLQVNVTVAIANWEGIGRKASARDNRKGLK